MPPEVTPELVEIYDRRLGGVSLQFLIAEVAWLTLENEPMKNVPLSEWGWPVVYVLIASVLSILAGTWMVGDPWTEAPFLREFVQDGGDDE